MIENLLNLINPITFFAMTIGVCWGILNGALPGFGPSTAIAVLIPFTYGMSPIISLSMLAGVYAGGVYGGSITAIIVGIPGTSASVATVYDGYEMAKKGQAQKALTAAVLASAIGGVFSGIVLLVLAPPLARIGLLFGPQEYFLLSLFGLTIISSLSGGSFLKGIIGGLIGLFIGTIGTDPIRGHLRFTFGYMYLFDSIPLIPLILGLFAFPQCLLLVKEIFHRGQKTISSPGSLKLEGDTINLKEIAESWKTFLRSSIIGTIIGIIPAAGANIASFIGYSEAKRNSKHPEKFGTGLLEGVIATETANNAVCGGSLIPLLTLGIPGNSTAAVLLGALTIHGLRPGFQLFKGEQSSIIYTFILSMIFTNIIMLIIGWYSGKFYSKIAYVPTIILAPVILLISMVGAFITREYIFDMTITTVIGIVAFYISRSGIPIVTILLGAILGPIAEAGLRRAMLISNWDIFIFFKKPLSVILIILIFFSIFSGINMRKVKIDKK